MINIRFIPIFEDEKFVTATNEYTEIWTSDGQKILHSLELISNLKLREDRIAVLVYEGVSFSGRESNDAMKLRASYNKDVKKGTLIHELSHRLLFDTKIRTSEDGHKLLNLFLYDVWNNLYGKDFSDMMVDVESERSEMYKKAWKYALSMNSSERKDLFTKLVHS